MGLAEVKRVKEQFAPTENKLKESKLSSNENWKNKNTKLPSRKLGRQRHKEKRAEELTRKSGYSAATVIGGIKMANHHGVPRTNDEINHMAKMAMVPTADW